MVMELSSKLYYCLRADLVDVHQNLLIKSFTVLSATEIFYNCGHLNSKSVRTIHSFTPISHLNGMKKKIATLFFAFMDSNFKPLYMQSVDCF